MTDQAIEQEIQAKGLTAPRITPADLKANIVSEHYFTAYQGDAKAVEDAAFSGGALNASASRAIPDALRLLTFCVLVLRNGFTVTGESACASPENFDTEIGRKIARDNAVDKVWPLMGYQLREQLHQRALFEAEPKCATANEQLDCPHAAPHRYCPSCVADPCPIGLDKAGTGSAGC